MTEDLIHFELPRTKSSIIKVIGVGGGGSNAVNFMFRQGIRDVDFIICNTDAQALNNSQVPTRIHIGQSLTEGLGAGNIPDVGKQAALENIADVIAAIKDHTKMIFITAGMGGGTGTGAAPVIAKAAKDLGILTVAIVTIPFRFEGPQRINQAIDGINELKNHVDSLLVINNEKLREIYGNLKVSESFSKADNVLTMAARGIAEIITVHGHMNVDFADVKTVMANSGVAVMGSAQADGDGRAISAIEQALNSPLLNNNDIKGAKNILLNITSGIDEITMDEIYDITDYVTSVVDKDVNIIWGTGLDDKLVDKIAITIIATGFEANTIPELYSRNNKTVKIPLNPINTRPVQQEPIQIKRPLYNDIPERQRLIDFEQINPYTKPEIEKEVISQKSYGNDHEYQDAGFGDLDEKTIEELEKLPAFLRKNKKAPDSTNTADNISKYRLSSGDNGELRLRPDNPFIHDNVD